MFSKFNYTETIDNTYLNHILALAIYIFFISNEYYERGHGIVSNLKLVEIVVLGATALLAAARYVVKFLDYVFKLQTKFAVDAI